MSQLHATGFTLFMLCMFAAGCSSVAGRPERSVEADKIAVYESVPRDPRAYRLVKRVWVEPWKSAFTVPIHKSIEEGASDLENQAVTLGGDAIMYFGCYHLYASTPAESRPDLVCNGSVIKYVQ